MPFKSKAQAAKIAELEKQGKVKKGTTKEWASKTPNMKTLPKRVTPKKAYTSLDQVKEHAAKKYGKK